MQQKWQIQLSTDADAKVLRTRQSPSTRLANYSDSTALVCTWWILHSSFLLHKYSLLRIMAAAACESSKSVARAWDPDFKHSDRERYEIVVVVLSRGFLELHFSNVILFFWHCILCWLRKFIFYVVYPVTESGLNRPFGTRSRSSMPC